MNDLELAIKHAFDSAGNNKEANKAYLEFIKANLIIPIDKNSTADRPEVLYIENNGEFFLPVFTNMEYLDFWAHEISDAIQLLKLSGVDLLKGLGEQVTICLNIGSTIYKEFNPAELARMKSMVLKLFK
jgi:hypothetical protein